MNDRTKSRILVLLLMSLALVLSGIELPRDDHPPAPAVSDDGWTVRRASAGGMEHGAVLVRGGLPFAYAPSHDDGR